MSFGDGFVHPVQGNHGQQGRKTAALRRPCGGGHEVAILENPRLARLTRTLAVAAVVERQDRAIQALAEQQKIKATNLDGSGITDAETLSWR